MTSTIQLQVKGQNTEIYVCYAISILKNKSSVCPHMHRNKFKDNS